MRMNDIARIRKEMEKRLEAKRFEHTLGVAYTAACMSMIYGVNPRKAELAGLLHDCAKGLSDKKMVSLCEKYNLSMSDIEKEHPYLLHSKVGSFIAMKEFGIEDEDVINAILNHTTGRPCMSELEKIVFVADYIEPNRKPLPELPMTRKLAFADLDRAVLKILEDTLVYLNEQGNDIDTRTQETCDFYKEVIKERGKHEF